jgi:hypothetical protein
MLKRTCSSDPCRCPDLRHRGSGQRLKAISGPLRDAPTDLAVSYSQDVYAAKRAK